ncbi:hypothetical protein [Sphingobium sp.]|uniref:hypothetical protein n=1 Tax=Sphingobium sp. TaxID=1912891 RepID=UPI0039C91BF4
MRACGVTQAKLGELMDVNKTTISHLVNSQIDYNPEYIRDVALALQIEPFELLLPPERAMALRQYRSSAEQIVTLAHDADEQQKSTAKSALSDARTGTSG